jgi:hypothetical protein
MPTYGKAHVYELVLVKEGEDLVAISDVGSVYPNGWISGRITTRAGDYGLPGAKVYLEASIEGQNSLDSTYSDETGYYQFDSVYYVESAEFKLTVVFPGQIFSNNPRTIELSRERPEANDINFQASKGYVLEADALPTMDEFTLTADTLQNAVQLYWTYRKPAGDTVFVQVIRDGQLLALWMDTDATAQVDTAFLDISGKPKSNPRYTVRVYSFVGTDTLTVSSISKSISYPNVYPVTSLEAPPDAEIGVVELSWDYLATHISGFKVYRDGSLVITLPPSTTAYTDRGGIPVMNQDHVYTVTAFTERNGVAYESPNKQKTATYPYLPQPQNLAVEQVSEQDHILITWEQSVLDHPDYNFDGYLIFRKKEGFVEELARIDTGYPKAFKDLTGVPGTDYTYGVASYVANRLGAQWSSDTTFSPQPYTFPLVTSPHSFTAAVDSATRSVQLEWQHASNYADGFYLYKDPNTDPIAVLPGNTRSYSDYLDNAPENITYYLEAFVLRGGEAYTSDPDTAQILIKGLEEGTLALPTQFQASTTYPDRVQLSWEYLPYLLPEFMLYRDGSLLATLDAFQRSFADTTAETGLSYTYALEAVRDTLSSAKVYSNGAVRSLKRLIGRVATADGAYGVSGASIQVIDSLKNEVYDFTTTDAAGYFRFEDLPFEDSIVYWVRAEAINHVLQDSVLSVTLIEAEDEYEVYFISEKMWPAAPEDGVAEPFGVAVLTDDLNTTATVHWSVNSANYSGFEVYRSLDLLGTVGNGGPLSWTDEDGVPAIDYSYRVRAYWDREGGRRVFSDYASQPATFPALAPVENLKAIPNLDFDRVELSWSHPTDRVDHYLIIREGESTLTTTVPVGTSKSYQDTRGLPGQIYRYSVYAVKEVDGEAVRSIPVVIRNVSYPGVAPVKNLQVQTLVNGIQLDWARTDEDIEGYYVYRDDEPIADLPGGTYTYQDYGGVQEATHVYAVAAYYTAADGEIYTSDLRRKEQLYPRLTAPDNLVLQDSVGGKLLKWIYPYVDGYDGFELFLARDTIEWVVVSADSLSFYDDGGLPGESYPYGIRVYKKVAGKRFYSGLVNPMNSIYPSLPAPYSLMASDGDYYGYVLLEWTYESDLNDGFVVYRDEVAIDTIRNAGARRYQDIISVEELGGEFQYYLKAFKVEEKEYFESEPSYAVVGSIKYYVLYGQFGYNGYSYSNNNVTIYKGRAAVQSASNIISVYEKTENGIWRKVLNTPGILGGFFYPPSFANFSEPRSMVNIKNVDHENENENGYLRFNLLIYDSFGSPNHLGIGIGTGDKFYKGSRLDISPGIDFIYKYYTYDEPYQLMQSSEKVKIWSDKGFFELWDNSNPFYSKLGVFGVAVNNKLAAATFISSNTHEIRWAYKKEDGNWSRPGRYIKKPGINSEYFGRALEISEDYLFIGDEFKDQGEVYYTKFDWEGKKWENLSLPITADDDSVDEFGYSIAVEKNIMAVGAPGSNQDTGAVYIFERQNGQWNQIRKITENNPEAGSRFGLEVRMSGDNLIVAAQNKVSFFELNNPNPPNSVVASKGDYSNFVKIKWGYNHRNDFTVQSFRVYRSMPGLGASGIELLGTVSEYFNQYSDSEAVPGRHYVYYVAAVNENGEESLRIADIGWSKANGTINGQVVSQRSFSGVSGITVTASAMVDGERHRRSMVTGPSGEFSFKNLPYGDSTTYEVKAFASGHAFVEDVKLAELTPEQSTAQLDYFLDKTAFILEGKLHPQLSDCGIEGVKVMMHTFLQDQNPEIDSTITNEKGAFSFNIDKYIANLESIQLSIASYSIVEGSEAQDTLFHQFSITDTTFSRAEILDFENPKNLDIVDEVMYKIPIQVANACGETLGEWNFTVEVKAKDGCFRKLYKTDKTGFVLAELPPMDYLITVREVTPVRQANIPVIEYLKYRPENFDLATLHRGEMGRWTAEQRQQEEIPVQIIYHRKPQISLVRGLNRYLCDDRSNPAILVQNNEVNLTFSVQEATNTSTCEVGEGFLVIKNGASAEPATLTIQYDSAVTGFPEYSFTVGNPQTIEPYVHYLIVEYHTESDGYLTEWIQSIIVEGVKAVPGSDVIVDAFGGKDEEGVIKYPLMVLRDPPGDQSYSFIKSGTTFESTFSIGKEEEEFSGLRQDFRISVGGAGVAEDFKNRWGDSKTKKNEFKILTDISEQISTDEESIVSTDGEYVIGPKADVIAGVGIANQYGLGQEVRVNKDGCGVSISTKLLLSGMKIQTQWIYTVNHIETILLPELKRQKADLKTGTFEITGMEEEEADAYLGALIDNWNVVLNYYREKTLPYYCLCDPATWPTWKDNLTFDGVEGSLNLESLRENLDAEWRKPFCEKIGIYKNDTFKLNEEPIIWTEDLINKYHILQDQKRRAIEFVDSIRLNPGKFIQGFTETIVYYPPFSTRPATKIVFKESEQINTQINKFINKRTPLFETDIRNLTFSGNTSYAQEVTSQRSQFTEISSRDILDRELFIGAFYDTELGISTGFISVGTNTKVLDFKLGFGYTYNYRKETSIIESTAADTTVTTGYVLSDDDDGDQYSVTSIRGISPNHTPYFELVGGRSACPPFEGTILRERPQLTLESPNGQGVNNVQYNIPADGTATFPLAIKNENPFNEARWFYVNIDPRSNPRGAWVFLDGLLLSEELYRVPANEPLYATLQVERGPGNFYQYEDLRLIIRSYCSDVRANTAIDRDTIHFSVFFDHPCSDVSITEPGNNWVIKRRNPLAPDDREQLLLRIADYDLANEQLDSLRIQYRRVGTAASGLDVGWVTETILTRDSLINYYEEFRLVYSQPQYLYAWDITDRPEILDGDYEIRVVADCGPQGVIISNVIRGRVDRSLVELLGFPQPDDGFLHRKELIKVAFTEKLDCGTKEQFAISLRDQETGQDVPFTCLCYDNYIELRIADSTRNTFDGQVLTARIDTVYDIAGNSLLDPIVWSFQVVQSPLYWSPNELEFDIYQGETREFTAQLYNTGGATDFRLTYPMDSLELLTDDLTIYPNEGSGKDILFRVNTDKLEIDSYRFTVFAEKIDTIVQGDFYSPYLEIKVNVLGKPPAWQPDPTLYEDQMILLANYQFTDALPSTDTTDVISAWIGNEIRGVGNIEKSGDHYVAYLFVYGDKEEDLDKPLEFRVWNAKQGKEYDAHPADSIFFRAGKTVGSSLAPEILVVNRLSDEARYIPLNGGGWTWFSLNTDQQGNPLNSVLRSLKATDGDFIRTKNKSASYLAQSEEWITLDSLDSLAVEDGFAIWLQGADDTLRVTGADADVNYLPLDKGWHFIGYPPQEAKLLDESFFTDLPGSANMYVTRSALDNNDDDFAEYSSSAGWLKDFDMRPNRAYQLYVSDLTTWTFGEGTKAKPMGLVREKSGPIQTPQPQQADTWTVNPADYANTMIVIADLLIDGEVSRDSLDRVAAFVGEECRGVAELEYIKALDQYQLSLFIYSNEPNEEVSIYLYDASRKEVYLHEEQLNYRNNAIIGKMSSPYHLVNLSRPKAHLVAEDLYCKEDPGGRITIAGFVSGTAPFEVQWSTGSTDMQLNDLAAGTYVLTITDASGQAVQDSVTIREFDLSAMRPTAGLMEDGAICVGESALLMADSLVPSATFSWYDEKENRIGEDAVLLLTNLQKDRRVYLEANIHGCRSDRGIVEIRVQQPDASFDILAEPMAQPGDTIRFSPVIGEKPDHLYRWSFGDGSTSEEVRPIHIYTQAGTYDVSLEVTDESGCTNEVTQRGFLQIGNATGTDQWPVWLSEWTVAPNPFHQILHVNFVIHRSDAYWISLRDQWGREINRQKMDLNAGKHSILLDVAASLPDGSYYVEIKNEAGERGLYKVVRQ